MTNRLSEQEKEKKAQIILLERFSNSFYMLTDDQAGRMLKAIFRYKMENQEPDFQNDSILAFFWQDIKKWLDDSEEHYNRVCETNRANANARWNKSNTTACDGMQTNTNYPKANAKANAEALDYPKKEPINLDSTNKGSGDFETAVRIYQENIGDLRSPKEAEQLKALLGSYHLGCVTDAIRFMASKGGKSVNYLTKVLETNVDF